MLQLAEVLGLSSGSSKGTAALEAARFQVRAGGPFARGRDQEVHAELWLCLYQFSANIAWCAYIADFAVG